MGSFLRLTWRTMVMALVAVIGAFSFAGLILPPSSAGAADIGINQCNGLNGSPTGATTGLTCTVTVVNTIKGASRGSTTTVTRLCTLGPCPGGNGTFTSKSTSVVTNVTQCNSSANDAAPPRIVCRVNITNNISSDTLRARSVTAATVNQCVGSGTGGGKFGATGPLVCDPTPAATTGATVTQCNGSVTGGGSTAVCSVASASRVSPALAVRVNQCNGTGNKGGTLLTCSASIINNITAAAGRTSGGTPNRGNSPPQVTDVPSGGVDSGGGATAVLDQTGLLMLGGGLLLAAAMSALFGRRVSRRE
jgi:hypothetical protein